MCQTISTCCANLDQSGTNKSEHPSKLIIFEMSNFIPYLVATSSVNFSGFNKSFENIYNAKGRGGRLTALDATSAQCFAFWRIA